MDKKQFDSVVAEGKEDLFALHDSFEQASEVVTLVDATMQHSHRVCNVSRPGKTKNNRCNNDW